MGHTGEERRPASSATKAICDPVAATLLGRKGQFLNLESPFASSETESIRWVFHDSTIDPADKLLSRRKEPSPKGKQSRQSGAEQQQRAARIRHPPRPRLHLRRRCRNGIAVQGNRAIPCQQSPLHVCSGSRRD